MKMKCFCKAIGPAVVAVPRRVCEEPGAARRPPGRGLDRWARNARRALCSGPLVRAARAACGPAPECSAADLARPRLAIFAFKLCRGRPRGAAGPRECGPRDPQAGAAMGRGRRRRRRHAAPLRRPRRPAAVRPRRTTARRRYVARTGRSTTGPFHGTTIFKHTDAVFSLFSVYAHEDTGGWPWPAPAHLFSGALSFPTFSLAG